MRLIDTNLKDINYLQERIMVFIDEWAKVQRVPIPRKLIIAELVRQGIKPFTVVNAIRALDKKGYIRKAVTISNSTSYVQLRGV